MAKVAWSPQARVELKEILKFIARNDGRPQTAAKIDAEIREKLLLYAESPGIGQRYAGLLEGTRYCIQKGGQFFIDRLSQASRSPTLLIRPATFQNYLVRATER